MRIFTCSFPVNYNASCTLRSPSYEFSNGGSAVVFHRERNGDYKNQMSVYGDGGYAVASILPGDWV